MKDRMMWCVTTQSRVYVFQFQSPYNTAVFLLFHSLFLIKEHQVSRLFIVTFNAVEHLENMLVSAITFIVTAVNSNALERLARLPKKHIFLLRTAYFKPFICVWKICQLQYQ